MIRDDYEPKTKTEYDKKGYFLGFYKKFHAISIFYICIMKIFSNGKISTSKVRQGAKKVFKRPQTSWRNGEREIR